ncbi:hypothetical protein [uncultured Tenacibaculum sp.]|uniref:hypothetical protein n=1 Tax=uncultured Tenacibaculum sp. TaxID=174713 RepID=UPI00261E8ECF|nr:hypothetical protein [uncultured Tenacibaculum sp.]
MKKKKIPKIGGIVKKENVKKAVVKANAAGNFIVENKTAFFVVGGIILGYMAIRKIQKGFNSVGEVFASDEVDFIKPVINPSSSNTTITSNDAVNIAKALLDAFNQKTAFHTPATDEKKIKEAFEKIKTGDDFKLVFNAFGLRKRMGGGTPTHYLDKKFADSYDLIYWLKAELDSYWDREVYNIVKQRVESAGLIF